MWITVMHCYEPKNDLLPICVVFVFSNNNVKIFISSRDQEEIIRQWFHGEWIRQWVLSAIPLVIRLGAT